MAIQDDNTILNKGDLKAYHERILPYLGGNFMMSTNNSDYYSTNEKMVGVWTDGKPVYQRVIESTMPVVATTGTAATKNVQLSDVQIDTPISAYGMIKLSNHVNTVIPSVTSGADDRTWIRIFDNSFSSLPNAVQIVSVNSVYNDAPVSVIIQYTKTTDAAGSAAATPGAYDVHRPDTWPTYTEIFFGNGLYGYRAKSTLPAGKPPAQNSTQSTYNIQPAYPSTTGITPTPTSIVNVGGYFTVARYNDVTDLVKVPFGSIISYDTGDDGKNPLFASSFALAYGSYGRISLNFTVFSPRSQFPSNAPYDVWMTYTK